MKKWGDLKQGDRVEWSYRHHLNSSSWTMITKVGTFIRLKKCKTIFGNIVEYSDAIVKFDGNKTNSTVYAPHLKRPLTDKTIDMNTPIREITDFVNVMKTTQTLINGCDIETVHVPSLLHKLSELLPLEQAMMKEVFYAGFNNRDDSIAPPDFNQFISQYNKK